MRLSILILSLAIPAAAASAAPVAPTHKTSDCLANRMIFADQKNPRDAQPRKLGKMPPAKLYLSVDRVVAGCRKPAIIRYDIGAVDEVGRSRGP